MPRLNSSRWLAPSRWLDRQFAPGKRYPSVRRGRPTVEALEDRLAPASLDLGPLRFTADTIVPTAGAGKHSTTGTVTVGFKSGSSTDLISLSGIVELDNTNLADTKFTVTNGDVTPAGQGLVYKDCTKAGTCGYYTYLQGTSMASPHAAGVAALIVSRFGHRDAMHPGTLTLEPGGVELIITRTAADHACPDPPLQTYTNEGRPASFNALCVGSPQFNGFYGNGIVDAFAAVTFRG